MVQWCKWVWGVFLLIFLVSCIPVVPSDSATNGALSDMQITACTAAHDAGTCDSRLPEVGIVLQEECCEQLGKCCP